FGQLLMIVGKSRLHFKAFTSNAFLNVQKVVSKLRFWSSFLRRCVGDSYVSRQFPTFHINNRRSRALFTTGGRQRSYEHRFVRRRRSGVAQARGAGADHWWANRVAFGGSGCGRALRPPHTRGKRPFWP